MILEEKEIAGPLKGLKILDFTALLPGPYATMTLADLGADVLRIVSGSRESNCCGRADD